MGFSLYCGLSAYIIAHYMQIVKYFPAAVIGNFDGILFYNSLDFLPIEFSISKKRENEIQYDI